MIVEYVCEDCRYLVHAWGIDRVPDPPLCRDCEWRRAMAESEPDLLRKNEAQQLTEPLAPPRPTRGR